MRIFLSGAATAFILAGVAWFGLGHLQESVANAYNDHASVRLDYQEAVNNFGRQEYND